MSTLSKWRTVLGVLRQPQPRAARLRSFATIASQVENLGEAGPPRSDAFRLRNYQEECIQSVLSSLTKGHKRLGISLATGSGKTVIFTQLISRIPAADDRAVQCLILAHRRELVEQAARQCEREYPDKSIEIEMGENHASGAADITVASVRSITSKDRLQKFNPERFKLVLVDEAHHIVAPKYLEVLRHFSLDQKRDHSPVLVGVSATMSRFDGLRLGAAIDYIVYHKDWVDLIGDKWLSDVTFTTVKSAANMKDVKNGRSGDFDTSSLSEAVNVAKVTETTIKAWQAEAGDRKSTLVFAVDLQHVYDLTAAFRSRGVDARFVSGNTPKQTRSERLDAFKKGDFPVLVNCGVFTEGTDIPNIDCVLLARPTRSRNLLVQMIGRGMRLHPGKKDCHIIDMVASFGIGLVTTPTLFGLDPSEIVKDASMQTLREQKEHERPTPHPSVSEVQRPRAGKLSFVRYDSIHDLLDDTSGERHVRAISQNAWVQVGEDRYILAAEGGKIEIQKKDGADKYRVMVTKAIPTLVVAKNGTPWQKPREIATAITFSDAVHAADTYAGEEFERIFIITSAEWRRRPATEGQLTFLNKLRTAGAALTPEQMTRGRAADMITKTKYGARGRFDKIKSMERKLEKGQMKLDELKDRSRREDVQVGPV